jgi:predicted secreted protein
VLPLGVRGRWEADDDGVKGADPGAPTTPDLKKKALITTGLAAIATIIIAAIGASGVLMPKD